MSAQAPRGTHALRGRILTYHADPAIGGEGAHWFIKDGLVVIEDGLIAHVGETADLRRAGIDAPETDHRPHLLVPGFIDPHLHMPQTRVVGSHGATLMDWLHRYTFPEEARHADPAVSERAARFVLGECLANGTTSGAFFCTSHPHSADALLAEAERRSMRTIAGKVMMDREAPAALTDTPERAHDETRALIERWQGRSRGEVAITPRFAVTSTEAQLEVAGALAAGFPAAPIQTHLSENDREIAFVADAFPWAEDYTAVYERYGLVRPRALFGHGIHLSPREMAALGRGGASVVHCPTSNLFLGSGLFDWRSVRGAGARVGVATDIGGGTSYSMLATALSAYKVAALRGHVLDPHDLLHAITRGNAHAMGLGDTIGRLATGYEADVAVLDGAATPALRRRMAAAQTLEEELFALVTLGDDRAVAATYAGGRLAHGRDDLKVE